jgi:hypothetical protein
VPDSVASSRARPSRGSTVQRDSVSLGGRAAANAARRSPLAIASMPS